MEDSGQGSASRYDIRPEDEKLIQAAIEFGEWLLRQSEATESQRAAITAMLNFLRNLPLAPPPDFNGEFGFRFEPSYLDQGHIGSWMVSVCRGIFEIFGFGVQNNSELEWILWPGMQNQNSLVAGQDWVEQVRHARELLPPRHKFVIDASTWSVAQ